MARGERAGAERGDRRQPRFVQTRRGRRAGGCRRARADHLGGVDLVHRGGGGRQDWGEGEAGKGTVPLARGRGGRERELHPIRAPWPALGGRAFTRARTQVGLEESGIGTGVLGCGRARVGHARPAGCGRAEQVRGTSQRNESEERVTGRDAGRIRSRKRRRMWMHKRWRATCVHRARWRAHSNGARASGQRSRRQLFTRCSQTATSSAS